MITVLMTTYNAEKYVAEAIESVLKQTYRDFEFLVIDDGSTDETLSIVRAINDKRIKLHERKHDFIGALNFGLNNAKGKYIARMDADDVMHPERLRIQYAIMETEPSIDLCGSWMTPFGQKIKKTETISSFNGEVKQVVLRLLRGNAFFHPTMMFRTSFFRHHSLHYEEYPYAEDYKLWFEAAKCGGRFFVEPQPLLYYRISDDQVSVSKSEEQYETTLRIRREMVEYLINQTTEKDLIREYYDVMLRLEEKKYVTIPVLYGCLSEILRNSIIDKEG